MTPRAWVEAGDALSEHVWRIVLNVMFLQERNEFFFEVVALMMLGLRVYVADGLKSLRYAHTECPVTHHSNRPLIVSFRHLKEPPSNNWSRYCPPQLP